MNVTNTQKRISKTYSEIIRKADHRGEPIPYGYRLVPCNVGENIAVCLTVSSIEAEDVQGIFGEYTERDYSVEDIIDESNYIGEPNPKSAEGLWDKKSFSDLLLNPVYIKADETAYEYFVESGCIMHNPPEDFTEGNGCLVFSEHSDNMSKYIIKGCHVVLVPLMGIIPFDTWLKAREKWFRNRGN